MEAGKGSGPQPPLPGPQLRVRHWLYPAEGFLWLRSWNMSAEYS